MREVTSKCDLLRSEEELGRCIALAFQHKMDLHPILVEILPHVAPPPPSSDSEEFNTWDRLYRGFYKYLLADPPQFASSTDFMLKLTYHLEGCLVCLSLRTAIGNPDNPFGRLLNSLEDKQVVGKELAALLHLFNQYAIIPVKHANAVLKLVARRSWRDPTYGSEAMAEALTCERKLSSELFPILRRYDVKPLYAWPDLTREASMRILRSSEVLPLTSYFAGKLRHIESAFSHHYAGMSHRI